MRLAGFFDLFRPKYIPVVNADKETIDQLEQFYQDWSDKLHDHQLEAWALHERHKEEMKAFSVREKTIWREIEERYALPKDAMALSFERKTHTLGYYK